MRFFSKFFQKDKQDKYGVALDIGTEFVKALIFRFEEDRKVTVLGAGRQRQRLSDMQAGAVTNIGGVVESCAKALEQAEDMAGFQAGQAIVGIAGELVKGQTITVHYQRTNPESKITLAELQNIIQKVQWKAFDKVRQQLSFETGYSEIDVKLVNAAIVDVRIDGYRVTNPIGFQGKDVAIGIFNAFAPLVHLGSLQTITSELGLDLISIVAEPYAVARCLGADESGEFSAIFIDIGGGTTDIAVVSEGGVVGTKMFALGGRAFTKRLASTLGISFTKAEKLKLEYSSGQANPNLALKISQSLLGDCQVWLSGVELALSEFKNVDLLPSRILLCGGGSNLPEVKKLLSGSDWFKSLPFARSPKVHLMNPSELPQVIDATKTLKSPQDITPMALANLALDMTIEEGLLPSILRRAIKLLQT